MSNKIQNDKRILKAHGQKHTYDTIQNLLKIKEQTIIHIEIDKGQIKNCHKTRLKTRKQSAI